MGDNDKLIKDKISWDHVHTYPYNALRIQLKKKEEIIQHVLSGNDWHFAIGLHLTFVPSCRRYSHHFRLIMNYLLYHMILPTHSEVKNLLKLQTQQIIVKWWSFRIKTKQEINQQFNKQRFPLCLYEGDGCSVRKNYERCS